MIDVQLSTTMGRSLMGIALGVMAYQVNAQKKGLEMLKKESTKIKTLQEDNDRWTEMTTDLTTRMLDKRYKDPTYKKSLTEDDWRLHHVAKQNMLKSRTKYDQSVSSFNKMKADQKVKGSLKLINLKSIL